MQQLFHLGIDVGGTNTDTAILSERTVVASSKTPTSANVRTGIVDSVKKVMDIGDVRADQVGAAMIGTTQFTNALVERRRLQKVGIIRIAAPATMALRPCVGWPSELKEAVYGQEYILAGGLQYDGREIAPLDEIGLVRACEDIRNRGLKSVALSSVFSPIDQRIENRAADIIGTELPGVHVTCSSEIGRIGFLERENATIMNAALIEFAGLVVDSLCGGLRDLAIDAPLLVSQNDGSVMSTDELKRFPVLTFASGPTNSMRGAAFLSEISDGIVVDIGGTTSDIGVLLGGYPRESSIVPDIGGVRTNFRMPDILSLGLGGGTMVRAGTESKEPSFGPESVGSQLTTKALVFGGETLTATDIAVAAGYADVGDASLVKGLDKRLVESAVCSIHSRLAIAIDRMKTSAEDVPIVLVGGGSILINRELPGVSEIVVPENAAVANAIGAAMSQVSGDIDQVFLYGRDGRGASIKKAKSLAEKRALQSGALADSVQIVDVDEVPVAYVPNGATRVRVRAIGNLDINALRRAGG